MEFWPKVALLAGLGIILGPAVLRIESVIDNSNFTMFFVLGFVLLVIANNNRDRKEETSRRVG
ncbi:MAG TPA: hypothetical protein VFE98_11220 [Candidatus Bathyarchaeia archaeon]|nr:hypothetical protein [Candidatus Bathyarchaeia archaeon]